MAVGFTPCGVGGQPRGPLSQALEFQSHHKGSGPSRVGSGTCAGRSLLLVLCVGPKGPVQSARPGSRTPEQSGPGLFPRPSPASPGTRLSPRLGEATYSLQTAFPSPDPLSHFPAGHPGHVLPTLGLSPHPGGSGWSLL